ncbi:anthrone oxygenase family protein [Falsiroseomonas selenitidurans]|uniref:DUF1772 domain-containing protein n=1 Tax=Falsiroseomonas selenitidurans TaxID=2716335 RepID=A0ABX1E7B7_9PROT|nr:anthrone oxygenase family protein [Falsiroseomonas selenitidurans]NKC31703.1 DUF1772 domain-containing protein [Falsiroseomonas selenitidurans]
MPILAAILLGLAVLSAGWSAGFFWSWSFTVMPGLSAAAPLTAVEAMRAANAGIRTAFFAFVFFGPLPLALAAGAAQVALGARQRAGAAGAAAVVYGLGVILVTVLFNLPLNDSLAQAQVTATNAAETWAGYAGPWTAWNHLRVAASTATMLLLVLAVALGRGGRPGAG